MRRITRRWRSLLDAIARRVILTAVITAGAYLIERAAGSHPPGWSILVVTAGALAGGALGEIIRKVWAVTAAPRTEPDGEAPPAPAPESQTLIDQGRKIQAIKRYRELHPGTGLKAAKDIIDGLAAPGGAAGPGRTQ
jgi:hypothetical protein